MPFLQHGVRAAKLALLHAVAGRMRQRQEQRQLVVRGRSLPAGPSAFNGTCAANTLAVYRLYNNGQGGAPNHRYTLDSSVRAQMLAQGWLQEGYGSLGVMMCAPK